MVEPTKIVLISPIGSSERNPRSIRINNIYHCLKSECEIIWLHETKVQSKRSDLKIFKFLQSNKAFRTTLAFFKLFVFPDRFVIQNLFLMLKIWTNYRKEACVFISFSPPFSTHWLFYLIKKQMPKAIWITDIGDPFHQNPSNRFYNFLEKTAFRLENKVLQSVNKIVVNSLSIKELFIQKYKIHPDKISIIYNGPSIDFKNIASIPSDEIIFLYAGNTYTPIREGIQETQIILDIIHQLKKLNYIAKFILIGHQHESLKRKFKGHKEINFINHSSEKDLIHWYQKTSFLVNLANLNYPGVPSKLSEYRATGLPILCFEYDNNIAIKTYLENYTKIYHIQITEPRVEYLLDFILKNKDANIEPNMDEIETIKKKWISLINTIKK